jgi:hypothetical protein
MKQIIKQGATSKRLVVFIQNSSLATGAGLTGVTAAASGFNWYYYREDNNAATVVSGTTETLGTWTSGGFTEISSAHMPGFYEIGVPNAVLAATNSPTWATMQLSGVANMVPVNIEIELSAFDLTTATQPANVVQWLGTAVTSSAGVPYVDANVTQWLGTAVTSAAGVPSVSAVVVGTITSNVIQWLGTAVTGATGGIPDVNVKNWNNHVSKSDTNNYPEVDVEDVRGSTATNENLAIVPANVTQWLGTAVTSSAGIPIVDANLIGTPSVSVAQWLGTAVTSAAGVPNVNVIDFGGTAGTFTSGVPNVNATLAGTMTANVVSWLGTAVTSAAGVPNVNVIDFGGTAGTFAAGVPTVNAGGVTGTVTANVVSWLGTAVTSSGGVPIVDANLIGTPAVNVTEFGGTAGTFAAGVPTVSAGGITGTVTANVVQWLGHAVAAVNNGYPDVNTKYYNALTAQTDANQLPSVNAVDWDGTAVATPNVGGVPLVDVSDFGGNPVQLSGSFPAGIPEVAIQTNLDKTGYALSAGQITVKKDTALAGFTFAMFNATPPSSLATGLSVSSSRSIDGGAVAGTTNAVAEVGSGVYKINLSAADLNGNSITFIFTAPSALDCAFTFVTQP